MKFALVVLVALSVTVTWQASVVADNNQQQGSKSVVTAESSTAVQTIDREHRG